MTPLSTEQRDALREITAAIESMDGGAFDDALVRAFSTGLHESLVEPLIAAANATWHTRHEDVVQALQQLRPPLAVAVLEHLALSDHTAQHYDGGLALVRKCTWALADIGTAEAKQALARLATNHNTAFAAFAVRRIERWDDELGRKRGR